MSSPVLRGGDMPVTESGIRDAVRQVLLPLWNVWYFFSLYANADGYEARATDRLDAPARPVRAGQDRRAGRRRDGGRWTRTTSPAPARSVRSYLDALTNWYVRRSRDRFWAGDRGRVRHPVHGAGDAVPGGGAAGAADRRGDLARPDRRAVGAPDRLADRRRSSRPTTTWSRPWTRSATSARRRCRCARRKGLRVRLPLPALTVATPAADRAAAVRRPGRRRGQRQGRWRSPPTSAAYCQQVLTVVPRALGPRVGGAGAAGDQGGQGGRVVAGRRRTRSPPGSPSQRGRVRAEAGRRRRRALGAAARRRGRGGARHRGHARSWRPRAWPATWSGSCSRPAATPTWTSPTGSSLVVEAPAEVAAAVETHRRLRGRRDARRRR